MAFAKTVAEWATLFRESIALLMFFRICRSARLCLRRDGRMNKQIYKSSGRIQRSEHAGAAHKCPPMQIEPKRRQGKTCGKKPDKRAREVQVHPDGCLAGQDVLHLLQLAGVAGNMLRHCMHAKDGREQPLFEGEMDMVARGSSSKMLIKRCCEHAARGVLARFQPDC
eukprot:1158696-Pelagomonas_calceolata.AAC.14